MSAPGWVRWWFRGAAVYGLLVLLPTYFAPTVPEAEVVAYGFTGTAIAFQLAFWVIGGDPVRYRALMPVCVAEKLAFGMPVWTLFSLGKAPAILAVFGTIDLLLGAGFALAWYATPAR